jgi:UDP-glucose 4-epimerase
VGRSGARGRSLGSGRAVSTGGLVALCADVPGRPIEVESTPGRRRALDRVELVADMRLIGETTGWAPEHSLRETLTELLNDQR